MKTTNKSSRVGVRLTAVARGLLAEEAGPYGSISSVVRAIINKHLAKKTKGARL